MTVTKPELELGGRPEAHLNDEHVDKVAAVRAHYAGGPGLGLGLGLEHELELGLELESEFEHERVHGEKVVGYTQGAERKPFDVAY